MVKIKKITELTSFLFNNGVLVGEITSHLELNDCLIQIKANQLTGYSLLYEGKDYPIQSNGRIKGGREIYPILSKQMQEILGF